MEGRRDEQRGVTGTTTRRGRTDTGRGAAGQPPFILAQHPGRVLRPVLAALLVSIVLAVGIAPASVAQPTPAPVAEEPVATVDAATPAAPTATVLLNELSNGSSGSASDGFVELRNWGTEPVSLDGWELYRCSAAGLRTKAGAVEADLGERILQPGELLTISRVGLPGELHTTSPLPSTGFGLWLQDPQGRIADRVGVYPNEPWMTTSECSGSRNLPNTLDWSTDESWQRTGPAEADWIAAPSTIAAPNATLAQGADASGVVISEFAAAGPAGSGDDLVELRNDAAEPVAIGGWRLYRCSASGRLSPENLQLTVPAGTVLEPGALWLAGGPSFTGPADARYAVSLADAGSGVLLRSSAGLLADRVAMSGYDDSACQGENKLPAILDPVAGESWQRAASGWIVAPRTPGRANASAESSVFRAARATTEPAVAISEVANDPGGLGSRRNAIEIANYGDSAVDIGGWTLRRCTADGLRATQVQVTVPGGTELEAGATWTAALAGTDTPAQAHYEVALNFLGTGVWLADAQGERRDSVGIFGRNELDGSIDTVSVCSNGLALTTFAVDRLLGETFQRVGFSGVDADDFRAAAATPGRASALLDDWRAQTVARSEQPAPAEQATAVAAEEPLTGSAASVLRAWSGVSDAPLTTLVGADEQPLTGAETTDDGYGFPYQRYELDASALQAGDRIGWSGESTGRNELQLSVWTGDAWRLLDAGMTALDGVIAAGEIRDGVLTLLVQDCPRTEPTIAAGIDGELQDPADYDLAIAHVTDTQYLSEAYPEVYADELSWIAENADARKIAFTTHTGDLIQNWVDPDQSETRARAEFERASAVQSILDDAGVPNSVLPGNHDNKRGTDASLFNEYFGPARYADAPWYGGSIAPDDNGANYSLISAGGAGFLMLSLPYAYGEREIAWAEQVVAAHPDRNVIVSTHEHLSPSLRDSPATRSTSSRWLSRADELWDRVIAPNRQVIAVLSGHFHGIGQIVTEDAGGLPGHDVVELLADYQEFRTHTGERATGFQRLLQLDLDSGTIAVDTFSLGLGATASYPYDYGQFLADSGQAGSISNDRPWNLLAAGLQNRYDAADDEFTAQVKLQYPKRVATAGWVVAGAESVQALRPALIAPAEPRIH